MNVTATSAVGTTAQVFGAAKWNLKNDYLMAGTCQKQADHLRRAINRMVKVPVLADAMKNAPAGTELTAIKSGLDGMFNIGIKVPGKEKYKALFSIFPEQMAKREITDSAHNLAGRINESIQPAKMRQLAVA